VSPAVKIHQVLTQCNPIFPPSIFIGIIYISSISDFPKKASALVGKCNYAATLQNSAFRLIWPVSEWENITLTWKIYHWKQDIQKLTKKQFMSYSLPQWHSFWLGCNLPRSIRFKWIMRLRDDFSRLCWIRTRSKNHVDLMLLLGRKQISERACSNLIANNKWPPMQHPCYLLNFFSIL